MRRLIHLCCLLSALASAACGSEDVSPRSAAKPQIQEGSCQIEDSSSPPDMLREVTCRADFDALSSEPLDVTLPGARSVKVVLDQASGDALYFQNSKKYQIHHEFVSARLSGGEHPLVPALSDFNDVEYYKPDRRFLLGAVTYYEGPALWVLEMSPYDTASADMIRKLFEAVEADSYFGPALAFHPTSESVARAAAKAGDALRVVTTDEIYAGTDYQPLTLGESMGRLHFVKAEALESEYLSYRDIVVLDAVPNDISVVSGLITAEFQTPLSHVNVLSQNRGTPNMGLRGASSDATLRALDGKWVKLNVGATAWNVEEVTREEADAYWEAHRPSPADLPKLDFTVSGLFDIEEVVRETGADLRELLKKAATVFGGKAAHYSILAQTEDLPVRKAFAVPVFYYDQFMQENDFYARIESLLTDASFKDDPATRDMALASLREDMLKAPVNEAFQQLLRAKIEADYPGLKMRFRTSTNSEDLEGFPCAGCYESHTGDPTDWEDVLDAVRDTWATIWLFRTFEEREYYGVDHRDVGMALLVHPNFPDEEANGVALTANPFDPTGLEPGFYVNVQLGGDAEVVAPPPGVTSDEFLYFYSAPNRPISFLTHSNLVPAGATVLSTAQTYELGQALARIHARFSEAYGPAAGNQGWYAMDVEFKFDEEAGEAPHLYIKQARPHPGRGIE
jgi:hypothetical protein